MEIRDENESYGIIRKTQHISISRRDTLMNDLKNSTIQGMLSLVLAIGALFLVGFSVFQSYRAGGHAGYIVGVFMIVSIILSGFSIFFGVRGLKNRKRIRHYMERRGIVISVLVIIGLMFMYIRQLIQFLH